MGENPLSDPKDHTFRKTCVVMCEALCWNFVWDCL